MTVLLLIGVVAWILVLAFAIGLCRDAARGDRIAERRFRS